MSPTTIFCTMVRRSRKFASARAAPAAVLTPARGPATASAPKLVASPRTATNAVIRIAADLLGWRVIRVLVGFGSAFGLLGRANETSESCRDAEQQADDHQPRVAAQLAVEPTP